MNCLARCPAPDDSHSGRELVQALQQLSREAQRLEAELRVLTEKHQRPPPVLRLVWPEPVKKAGDPTGR